MTLTAHLATAVSRPIAPEMLERLLAPWRGAEGQAAYYRQVAQYDYAYTDRLEPLYARIERPARVFWGDEDRWVAPSEGARLAQMIPGAALSILPDAGHFSMLDTPGLVSERLASWLEETS